jgi:RNA polymerase sigma factor (sigma-70 family)
MIVNSEQDAEPHPVFLCSPVWKTAYRNYHRFWLNLAKGQHVSDDEAEDILHSILCSILSDSGKQFRSVEHIRNYVARAILNRTIEVRKEAGRKSPLTEAVERLYAVDEEKEGESLTLRNAVREGLQGLSRSAFQVIKLRFYAGLTFNQISQMLNLPISTIKSREEAAIKKIRASLRKKGY